MKKKYVLVTSSILIISLLVAGFGYYKKVQAKNLENKFNEDIKKNQYLEAFKIYKTANEDKVIKKVFNFNKAAEGLVSDAANSLQNDYLNYKINFQEFEKEKNELSKFEFLNKIKLEKQYENAKTIENTRLKYNECEAIYEKKDYANALIALDNILTEDAKMKDKINTLRMNIKKDYKALITQQIDVVVKSEKFDDGIKLLNNSIVLFSEEEISNRKNEINKLINAKAEEEKKKKALEEERRRQEAMRREEAAIGVYLSGYAPNPDKENSVKDMESETKFLLTVELNQQSTNVFIGKKGEWKLIKNISCSTGAPGYDTPRGSFKIGSRGNWFFSKKYNDGAEYWTSFLGDYLFHSLPMNSNHVVTDETLGKPASHGCVRMKSEDAKWIYSNVSSGTKVIIR